MNFVGHQKNWEHLRRLVDQDQLPHALLFAGPSGIGKKRAALHLIQMLFCPETNRPCENCSSCRRIESYSRSALQGHPDLVWIEPEKGLIKIETIRTLKSALALKPFEAPLKVAILTDAHALNPAASNALLKTLE